MHFTKSLFVGAACVAAAVAQGLIAFTDVPASVSPGDRVPLGWGGGNPDASAKIDLYEGDYRDLQFVRTITDSGTNGQFVWTVPADLPNRNDYSLQISQGLDDNYSGPFQLTGSNAVSSASSSQSQTETASASSSSSASNAVTTNAGVVVVQSVVASNTTTTISDNNATTTLPAIGTGVGASGGAATGTAMSRNTTMARPTLSSTSSESAATTEGTTSEPTGESSTGGGEEEAPSSGAIAMEVASFASPLALILSAVAAIMFLA